LLRDTVYFQSANEGGAKLRWAWTVTFEFFSRFPRKVAVLVIPQPNVFFDERLHGSKLCTKKWERFFGPIKEYKINISVFVKVDIGKK
jgi:hypothetical protein